MWRSAKVVQDESRHRERAHGSDPKNEQLQQRHRIDLSLLSLSSRGGLLGLPIRRERSPQLALALVTRLERRRARYQARYSRSSSRSSSDRSRKSAAPTV